MRLGVISDSHGELDNLRQAAFILINEWKVDKIVHLGDECEDTVVFQEYPPQEIIQVHGSIVLTIRILLSSIDR